MEGGSKKTTNKFLGRMSIIASPQSGEIIGGEEKFAAKLVSSTELMSVRSVTNSGRSDLDPVSSLSYDSGRWNGPVSFFWYLLRPLIVKKTNNHLSQHVDSLGRLTSVEFFFSFLFSARNCQRPNKRRAKVNDQWSWLSCLIILNSFSVSTASWASSALLPHCKMSDLFPAAVSFCLLLGMANIQQLFFLI